MAINTNKQNTDNVSVGKGIRDSDRSGWIWIAPPGTKLPETATEKLDDAFVGTGFISSDGLTEPAALSLGDTFTDANGDVTGNADPTYSKQWTGTFQEYLSPTVIKALFGEEQTVINAETGEILVDEKAITLDNHVIVVDELLSSTGDFPRGRRARYIMPKAQIALTDDITHNSTTQLGYGFTITAYATSDYPAQRRIMQILKPTAAPESRAAEDSGVKATKSTK